MSFRRTFEPYTIEVTKQLDVAEADEKAVARFRENPFSDEEPILQLTIGARPGEAELVILWARWRQFVQKISYAARESPVDSPVRTEEVTRRYRIQPAY